MVVMVVPGRRGRGWFILRTPDYMLSVGGQELLRDGDSDATRGRRKPHVTINKAILTQR
jgi:hypothetical protein